MQFAHGTTMIITAVQTNPRIGFAHRAKPRGEVRGRSRGHRRSSSHR
jgi:hypothetical protein